MTLNHDAIVSSASHLSMSFVLSVQPVSSSSANSLSLYLLQHSSFKAITSVCHPYLLSHLLALCHFSISASVSFYLFYSLLCLLYFIPHLPLPSVFFCVFFLNIDFHCLLVCNSLSLSGAFVAPNFSAYELMLLSSSSNFLTPNLFPSVPVPPAGGIGGIVLDGKKNEEEG